MHPQFLSSIVSRPTCALVLGPHGPWARDIRPDRAHSDCACVVHLITTAAALRRRPACAFTQRPTPRATPQPQSSTIVALPTDASSCPALAASPRPYPQFYEQGCDNCTFFQMVEDRDRVAECTTPSYSG